MAKDSIQKDTSANCGESKKSIVRKYPTHDNASRGESSTSTGKYGTRDNDYETALRLQRALDEEYAHHRPTYAATRPHLHPANPSSTSISNDDPPYPKNIQDAVDIVQRFIATVMKTKCHECRSGLMLDFDVEKWFRDWSASRDQKHVLSICAIPCPNDKCRASTCLGCGDRPRVGKFVGKHKIDGLVVDWCCESGRVFAIWALLCRYDQMELELQLLQDSQRKYRFSPPPNLSKYGYDIGYMSSRGLPRGGYGAPVSPILSFKQADSKTDKTTRLLIGLIIELLPLRNEHGKAVPQEMSAMIELSLLQDRAAELLRNDSLQDTTSRARLYFALFEFFERLGKHPSTSHLVYEERFAKKQSSGLLAISLPAVIGSKGKGKLGSAPRLILGDVEQMAASLINCMGNLAKQSQVLIKASQAASKEFHTAEGADLLEIANRVVDLYDSMAADQGRAQNSSGPSKNNFATWEEYHQNHCMVTEDNVLAHLVTKLAIDAKALDESPRNRIKRLVTEISEMSTSLPLNIFVKADTVRPDVMKCLIVGPEGTPYEYGLFEFDIFCPATYPKSPPQVWFCTTAGGKIRFNPNMYENGKVCLSLLGTWDGPPESKWQSDKSTILSVLVSIQALILCENPYTNEPSQHTYMGFAEGRKWCRKYDCNIEVWTLRFAILDWLRRRSMRDGIWKDVVRTYFRFHATKILAVARKWAPNNRLIEAYDGRVNLDKKGFFLRIIHPVNLIKELEAALPSVKQ